MAVALAAVSGLVLVPRPSHAREDEAPAVHASMQCDRASEPGRVRCTIEAHASPGRTITWADAVIVSMPDFASPLKGRLGKEDATARDGALYRWAFGLVARRAGQGEARARVRVVTCAQDQPARCAPATVDVRALLSVGS
jgi:hypothetical protein